MFADIEEKLIVAGLVILLIGGAIYAYTEHIHAEDKAADATLATEQRDKNAAEAAAYQKQLGDADVRHQDDLKAIAAANKPIVHLVCHKASSSPVPNIPSPASGVPAASGNAPDVRETDTFDPGPALANLSAAYERRVEGCRDALNRWPEEKRP